MLLLWLLLKVNAKLHSSVYDPLAPPAAKVKIKPDCLKNFSLMCLKYKIRWFISLKKKKKNRGRCAKKLQLLPLLGSHGKIITLKNSCTNELTWNIHQNVEEDPLAPESLKLE